MGAFLVVCMVVPIKNAVQGLSSITGDLPDNREYSSTVDEAYQAQVLSVTRSNLEATLSDILKQNGVIIDRAEVVLALTDENRVIISNIRIYINKENAGDIEQIKQVTEENFSFTPQIITEQNNEGTT